MIIYTFPKSPEMDISSRLRDHLLEIPADRCKRHETVSISLSHRAGRSLLPQPIEMVLSVDSPRWFQWMSIESQSQSVSRWMRDPPKILCESLLFSSQSDLRLWIRLSTFASSLLRRALAGRANVLLSCLASIPRTSEKCHGSNRKSQKDLPGEFDSC
jgi:hypothetical protein